MSYICVLTNPSLSYWHESYEFNPYPSGGKWGNNEKKNEKNTKFDEENAKSSNIFYTNGELEYIIICERWMRVKANLSK